MISPLQVKKLNIFLSFCILYFIYFNLRFKKKNIIGGQTKRFVKSDLNGTLDSKLLVAIENFCLNRSIDIKYSEHLRFTENSVILMEIYDLKADNFFKEKLLDICSEDEEKCVTSDLRAFIQAYFNEITRHNVIFEKIESFGKKYQLKKDSEGVLNEENGPQKIKALGLMLSLALATETILDFEVSNAFLTPLSNDFVTKHLDTGLYWIDKQQFDMYREIRSIKDLWKRKYRYRYDPNSTKPFKHAHDTSNLERTGDIILVYAGDYPFDLAAERIFVKPFEQSRMLIDAETQRFFGKPVEQISNTYDYEDLKKKIKDNYKIRVDLYEMFIDQPVTLDLIIWKDNSIYDWSTRMFWKAFKDLSPEEKMKIYRKVTGLYYIPNCGLDRLPRTRLVAHEKREIEFIPSRYEIRVPYYASLKVMRACLYGALIN